jgi:hypothetical protein
MLLEVLFAGSHELDSSELVAITLLVRTFCLESESSTYPRASNLEMMGPTRPRYNKLIHNPQCNSIIITAYLDAIRLDRNEAMHKSQLHRQIAHWISAFQKSTYVCSLDMVSSLSLARSFL